MQQRGKWRLQKNKRYRPDKKSSINIITVSKRFSTATSAATRLRPSLFSGSAAICALQPSAASTRKRTGRSESSKTVLPELSLDFGSAPASSRSLTIMNHDHLLVNILFDSQMQGCLPKFVLDFEVCPGILITRNFSPESFHCGARECMAACFRRKHHCSCSRRIHGPHQKSSKTALCNGVHPSLPLAFRSGFVASRSFTISSLSSPTARCKGVS